MDEKYGVIRGIPALHLTSRAERFMIQDSNTKSDVADQNHLDDLTYAEFLNFFIEQTIPHYSRF